MYRPNPDSRRRWLAWQQRAILRRYAPAVTTRAVMLAVVVSVAWLWLGYTCVAWLNWVGSLGPGGRPGPWPFVRPATWASVMGWYPGLLLPVALLGAVFWRARGAAAVDVVITEGTDDPVRVLVLFLSYVHPGPAAPFPADDPAGCGFAGSMGDEACRKALGAWRMPVEAIRHHLPGLERVVLIGSRPEGPAAGSSGQCDAFARLAGRLLPAGADGPRVDPLGAYVPRFAGGVDFEDPAEVFEAVTDLYRSLTSRPQPAGRPAPTRAPPAGGRYKERHIVIDITGGKKPPTAAGAIFAALAEQRRFQYVSTLDYSVKVYNLTAVLETP